MNKKVVWSFIHYEIDGHIVYVLNGEVMYGKTNELIKDEVNKIQKKVNKFLSQENKNE